MLRSHTRSLGGSRLRDPPLWLRLVLDHAHRDNLRHRAPGYGTEGTPRGATGKESMTSEDIASTPPANLRVVMQAKTAWASSLLEAVSSHNYAHIASNAEASGTAFSLESGFLVQDTLAYRTLATEFRQEVTILGQRR